MKYILMLLLTSLIFTVTSAQTHYGSSAGTQGAAHSYFGYYAGNAALNTSYENSFFGTSSGRVTTTGFGNTAVGSNSLRYNTTGYWNTAIGTSAMLLNTDGFRNTAIGRMALRANTIGNYNVANGYNAMLFNTEGSDNTATGSASLYSNIGGSYNVAIGRDALYSNTVGSINTAIGYQALYSVIDGFANTATGANALRVNTGGMNTAMGAHAMASVDQGEGNAAFGYSSLGKREGSYNTAFGALSLADVDVIGFCTGSFNSALGYRSGSISYEACEATNTTALGANTRITASNQIRLGDANVTSIGGQVQWSVLSDGRFKKDLKKDVSGLDFINQLNPVSYILDKKAINTFLRIPDSLQVDNEAARKAPPRQIGFVAQEVEAIVKKSGYVFSGVEAPQNENDPYTIRYAEFVVPLVKAVQELSSQVADLQQQLKKYTNEPTMDQQGTMGTGAFLYQNNPNPFSNTTEIRMELPETTGQANIIVYNLEGKQLKNIEVNERGKTGVTISGNELSAGMYLYALILDGKVVDTKRLILTQ
jgi:hypothetical protein